jgi:capsular exopolysaccharide synthesis family protein
LKALLPAYNLVIIINRELQMERIQKALEKAKEQRQTNASVSKRNVGNVAVAVEDISFKQTKNIEVPKETFIKNRIVAGVDHDPTGDVFKVLRTKIIQKMRENNWNVLAVTSPTAGNGKTLTATNLAISIAKDANYSVLLADMDFRRPKLHKVFGFEPEYGLIDHFHKNKPLNELLIHPGIESLVLLPAGKPVRHSSELLSAPKMLALSKELKDRYPNRIVVIDLPPILQTDDALAYMPNVDACVLVIAEGETSPEEVKSSLKLIDENKFIGSILNKATADNAPGYYY